MSSCEPLARLGEQVLYRPGRMTLSTELAMGEVQGGVDHRLAGPSELPADMDLRALTSDIDESFEATAQARHRL